MKINNYKSFNYFNNLTRRNLNNKENDQVITEEFNDFQQQLILFYQSCTDSDTKLNDEIIKQSTFMLDKLNDFLTLKCDFTLIQTQLNYIFNFINIIIDNEYYLLENKYIEDPELENYDINGIYFLDLHNFILSFVNFIYHFTEISSDQICCNFASTNYINILMLIFNNVHSSIILFQTINCFINLLDQKPLVSEYISYELYNNIFDLYSIFNIERNQQIYFDQSLEAEKQKVIIVCSLLEALCNFEIFLPHHYQKVVEENEASNPKQLYSSLIRLVKYSSPEDDNFYQLKADFFFKITEKIFRYADPYIKKYYMNPFFVNILNKFLDSSFNFRYDKQILYFFLRIAETGNTQAVSILSTTFCQYKPYKFNNQEDDYFDKQLIIDYCNLWVMIISQLNRPSLLQQASRRGIQILRQNCDLIIEITSKILSQQSRCEFEAIKATTLIHIALIDSKDNGIISKILSNLPDVIDRIQQLVDEADPENVILISNAIVILLNFASTQGSSFSELLNWFQDGKLLESLKEVHFRLLDDEIPCREIQHAIEMVSTTCSNNE